MKQARILANLHANSADGCSQWMWLGRMNCYRIFFRNVSVFANVSSFDKTERSLPLKKLGPRHAEAEGCYVFLCCLATGGDSNNIIAGPKDTSWYMHRDFLAVSIEIVAFCVVALPQAVSFGTFQKYMIMNEGIRRENQRQFYNLGAGWDRKSGGRATSTHRMSLKGKGHLGQARCRFNLGLLSKAVSASEFCGKSIHLPL